jgi:hypothetical protein
LLSHNQVMRDIRNLVRATRIVNLWRTAQYISKLLSSHKRELTFSVLFQRTEEEQKLDMIKQHIFAQLERRFSNI